MRRCDIHVFPAERIFLAALGAFHIDDFDYWARHASDIDVSTGLEHDGIAPIQQGIHEWINLLLLQWLSSRYLHELGGISLNNRQHFVQWNLPSPGVRILRVAVNAPE